MSTRAAASSALFALVASAYPWANRPARRVKSWVDVPPEQQPAMFMSGSSATSYDWKVGAIAKRSYEVRLFVYVSSSESNPGDLQLDAIEDAINEAMKPVGADISTGRNSLGGACYQARIKGVPHRIPGDLDNDGLMAVDIEIILP